MFSVHSYRVISRFSRMFYRNPKPRTVDMRKLFNNEALSWPPAPEIDEHPQTRHSEAEERSWYFLVEKWFSLFGAVGLSIKWRIFLGFARIAKSCSGLWLNNRHISEFQG
jgi:hypothetical protein